MPTKILIHHPILPFKFLSHFIVSGSDGTRDAGAFDHTDALRNLLQVLLVIVLSVVELLPLQDLCCDGTVAFFIQLLGVKAQA